jgi:hypothetical protein
VNNVQDATFYRGRAEIEMGGQQLTVDYDYTRDEFGNAEETNFKKITMLVSFSELNSALPTLHVHQVDVTDLLTEASGDDSDFWARVLSLIESQPTDSFPDHHHPDRAAEES